MSRGVFLLFLTISFVFANVSKDIDSNKKELKQKETQAKVLSNKLDLIAKEIKKESIKVKKITKEIQKYQKELSKQKSVTKKKKQELKQMQILFKKLEKRERYFGSKMQEILLHEFSISILSQNSSNISVDDLITDQILKSYSKILKQKFKNLKGDYLKYSKNITLVKKEIKKIELQIRRLNNKRAKLIKLKKEQNKAISKLKQQENSYRSKLQKIIKEKEQIAKTLAKLNIIQTRKSKTLIKESPTSGINVRQIGSSYQKSSVKKYRGQKTISPLQNYQVVQKFGNYKDPVYNLKIFNDSVVLRSNKPNAKVRSILNGKVIYADKTPFLENVIIIKSDNNIHTIYAHLSQIAPTVKVGKKVKKGYVIGRIKDELTFEVTQNEYHIDPLELIQGHL